MTSQQSAYEEGYNDGRSSVSKLRSVSVRVHYEIVGGHVHCLFFSAPNPQATHGRNGYVVFTLDEWPEVKLALQAVNFQLLETNRG